MGLQPGTRVGDWVVEQPLGDPDLYRCHRADTPFRKAFLRVVVPDDALGLQQEASELSKLQHPNIQGVLGLEQSGDDLYLVTEAIEGTLLSTFVRAPPLPLKAALEIAVQVADALSTAHRRDIVHRDVRPENVLLTADGRALLSGFELRNSLGGRAPGPYDPPERARGSGSGAQHDAYAFGVMLFELVRGERVQPVSPGLRTALSLEIDVPAPLRDLVMRLTHPDPETRCTISQARDMLAMALRQSLGDSHTGSAEHTFVDYDAAGPADADLPTPGRVGKYRVLREVGRGGVGVVYEAEDPELRRRVALKVLLAGSFARAKDIERFLREARAVARLDHPGIVKIHELGREGGGAWFAMDFVDGPTLLQRIRADGALPWREAVALCVSLARALQHAHDAGLVHRDVKPNNVMLEEGTRPRLTDFGLALDSDGDDAGRLTRTGQVLGTPMYMSPEQATGDLAKLGPRTDVYALGVLLYESLTGQVPYSGTTAIQVIGRVLAADPATPRSLVPSIPRPVEVACLKAMRRDIPDRYASAAALADDLERCLRGEPILAAAPGLRVRLRWYVRRNATPVGIAAAAIATALVVALGSTVALQARGARELAEREASAERSLQGVLLRLDELEAAHKPRQAEEVWQRFTVRPEHRGTAALVDGWLARADHHHVARDGDGRLAAIGMAYAAAQQEDDQRRALLELARGLREEGRLDRLPRVVDTLRRGIPKGKEGPEIRRLLRDALTARRDLEAAGKIRAGDAADDVVAALAGATRTEHHADHARVWPGDDAALLLRSGEADRMVLVAPDAALTEVRRLRVPVPVADRQVYPIPSPDGTQLLVGVNRGGTVLLQEHADRLSIVATWPRSGGLNAVASGDVDGDGVTEHYLGTGESLYRIRPGPGGWIRDEPHAGTNAAGSSVTDLAITDLDGDGQQELIASVAEWSAYDVRILAPADDHTLRLEGRTKLGVVSAIAPIPTSSASSEILAVKRDRFANRVMFPMGRSMGAPQGIWRLARDNPDTPPTADRLLEVECDEIMVGDLDGDGRADGIAACGEDILILAREADGRFADVWLRRLDLLAVVNVDGDAAAELVVGDPDDGGAVWVLGAGSSAPPALLPAHYPPSSPPEGADAVSTAWWQRAEDLVYIGQLEQAAAALEELAQQNWGQENGWQALMRAADLHDAVGNWDEAGRLYEQVAEAAPQHRVETLIAAAQMWGRSRSLARELRTLRALRDAGALTDDTSRRLTELASLADPPVVALDFDQGLDPRWEISSPLAIRGGVGGLRVEAYGTETMARLPVLWSGGHLILEVELEVERTEWNGGIELGLAPRGWDEPMYSVRVDGTGGGQTLTRRAQCVAQDVSVDGVVPTDDHTLKIRLHVFAQGDGMACSLVASSGNPRRQIRTQDPTPPPDEDWEFVMRATGVDDTLGLARIRSVRIEGASLPPTPALEPNSMRARQALAGGSPGRAARMLDESAFADPLLRIAIAAERDDIEGLTTALIALDDQAMKDTAISHLLHARLAEVGEPLQELLGASWPEAFERAWGVTLAAMPDDPMVLEALLKHLDGIERNVGNGPESMSTLVTLNARRGAAEVRSGRFDLGRDCLRHALILHARLAAGSSDAQARAASLQQIVGEVHVELAVLALKTGAGQETAIGELRAALAVSPAVEIAADTIAARRELSSLRGEPGFTALLASARSER